jgi:hypothetical protein
MARKARADGTNFVREVAAELARPLPMPLNPLSERAAKYWPRIINAKLISAWTEPDLDTAWGLCENLAKLEELRLVMQKQPSLYKDDKGQLKPHPVYKMAEILERNIQATKRHLQIHSAATNGKSDHQKDKNATARSLAAAIGYTDSDLIARPK